MSGVINGCWVFVIVLFMFGRVEIVSMEVGMIFVWEIIKVGVVVFCWFGIVVVEIGLIFVCKGEMNLLLVIWYYVYSFCIILKEEGGWVVGV